MKIHTNFVGLPYNCRPKVLKAQDEFTKGAESTLMEMNILLVGEIDLFEVVVEVKDRVKEE